MNEKKRWEHYHISKKESEYIFYLSSWETELAVYLHYLVHYNALSDAPTCLCPQLPQPRSRSLTRPQAACSPTLGIIKLASVWCQSDVWGWGWSRLGHIWHVLLTCTQPCSVVASDCGTYNRGRCTYSACVWVGGLIHYRHVKMSPILCVIQRQAMLIVQFVRLHLYF